MKNRKKSVKTLLLCSALLTICALGAALVPWIQDHLHPIMYVRSETEQLRINTPYLLNNEVAEEELLIPRGTKVVVEQKGDTSSVVRFGEVEVELANTSLCASLEECLDISYVYPRKLTSLHLSKAGFKLSEKAAEKGEALKVQSIDPADLDPTTGEIAWIRVEKEGQSFYIPGNLVETTKENALKTYATDLVINPVYDAAYQEGWSYDAYATQADLKGVVKKNYEDNPLRDDLGVVHITLENVLRYKEELLELHKTSGINSLVIALKGPHGQIWYDSDVPANYFNDPTAPLEHPIISKENLKSLIQELQTAGFYIIGRMETFEDAALAFDRPEWSVKDTSTQQPAVFSNDYWTSAYNRNVWEYNGELAIEFATLGVNEVQFDFCRFPDGTLNDLKEGTIDFGNTFNESKVSAIQGFLYYVKGLLEPYHVYAAADIYAGPAIDHYDYDIGQFYPAMAAAADIVCPMMYLDTFDVSSYGYTDVNRDAGKIIEIFTSQTLEMNDQLQNPGFMRIWLQGYNTTPNRIAQEINGVKLAGGQGYMLWTDKGDLDWLEYLAPGCIPAQGYQPRQNNSHKPFSNP